jgi:hypothetical protein
MRDLSTGADFGAQMMVLAGLYEVSKMTGHTPSIIKEKENEGYKIRIKPEIFPNFFKEFETINYLDHKWEWREINNDFVDPSVILLEKDINYNFPVKFSTYHYWIGREKEVKNLFAFSEKILNLSKDYIEAVKKWNEKEIVGVHFRRGDYLKVSSLKLSLDYYYEAIKHFDPKKYQLLLFSNSNEDLKWCLENFKPEGYTIYTTDHKYPDRLDMCVMSLCDHMIIANSSYSWWGAFLNENQNKKIICPQNYLNVPHLNYINNNWYPEGWTALNQI